MEIIFQHGPIVFGFRLCLLHLPNNQWRQHFSHMYILSFLCQNKSQRGSVPCSVRITPTPIVQRPVGHEVATQYLFHQGETLHCMTSNTACLCIHVPGAFIVNMYLSWVGGGGVGGIGNRTFDFHLYQAGIDRSDMSSAVQRWMISDTWYDLV